MRNHELIMCFLGISFKIFTQSLQNPLKEVIFCNVAALNFATSLKNGLWFRYFSGILSRFQEHFISQSNLLDYFNLFLLSNNYWQSLLLFTEACLILKRRYLFLSRAPSLQSCSNSRHYCRFSVAVKKTKIGVIIIITLK